MSTQSHEDYPEDEFDRAGRDRSPQGVHRAPRSLGRALLPLIAVVVLAPLLAWGAISLLGGTGGSEPPVATAETTAPPAEPTTEAPAEPPAAPTEETSAEPSAEPTEEETEEEAEVDYTAGIAVLNGAGINGLAGDVVAELSSEGFSGGTAADYASAAPATTTLYYNNADLAATAQEIGSLLGISNLVESASATQTTDIAIVLRSDYGG
ncbi:LytR C-terminal domain-containing protein [Georgenia sp. AZ-5]|uniref:LytR C-terminal domain-containing protein n=1 Tax=Georgenia sp. AZ-5 TaxID=3367526 RepID=UPI0037541B46